MKHMNNAIINYTLLNFVFIESALFRGTNVAVALKIYTSTGTAVAEWLRSCATNRKVAGSIPAGVSGFFIDIKFLDRLSL